MLRFRRTALGYGTNGRPRGRRSQPRGRPVGGMRRYADSGAGHSGAAAGGITQWVMVMVTATVLLWPAPSVTVTAKLSSPTKREIGSYRPVPSAFRRSAP